MRGTFAVMGLVVTVLMTPLGPAAAQLMREPVYTFVRFSQLEYRRGGTARPVAWDFDGWIGGDFTRLWVRSEGEQATAGSGTSLEVQALFSRLFAPFWEVQIGMRMDAVSESGVGATRVLAAFGLEGLAPYWFEMVPVVFVSQKGDVSGRLTSSYDVFVTQRLIAEPRMEINAAVQSVPTFGVGSGFNDIELGVRLRYEAQRKTAPYVGFNWERRLGETATMARAAGDDPAELAVVAGLRLWF